MPKQSEDTRIRPVKTVIPCSCVFASLWRYNEEDPCAVGYSTDCQLLTRHWTTSYSSKLCVCVWTGVLDHFILFQAVCVDWCLHYARLATMEGRMASIVFFQRPLPVMFLSFSIWAFLFFPGSANAPLMPSLFYLVYF